MQSIKKGQTSIKSLQLFKKQIWFDFILERRDFLRFVMESWSLGLIDFSKDYKELETTPTSLNSLVSMLFRQHSMLQIFLLIKKMKTKETQGQVYMLQKRLMPEHSLKVNNSETLKIIKTHLQPTICLIFSMSQISVLHFLVPRSLES